jgi:hypothetical protein
MRIHLILDTQRDDTPGRSSFEEVTEVLETELETLHFEVGDRQAVYTVRVLGIGRTAQAAAESARIRGN